MEKIKNIMKNKIFWIVAGCVILVAVIGISIFLISGGKKESEQEKLTNELKTLGIDFYENFYYKQVGKTDEERKEFLEQYKDIGVKIGLDTLARHQENEEETLKMFINSEKNEECDKTNSMVVIYPKDPYGVNDYTIDAILDCGFEVTETK